jgi:hypothetical protein
MSMGAPSRKQQRQRHETRFKVFFILVPTFFPRIAENDVGLLRQIMLVGRDGMAIFEKAKNIKTGLYLCRSDHISLLPGAAIYTWKLGVAQLSWINLSFAAAIRW